MKYLLILSFILAGTIADSQSIQKKIVNASGKTYNANGIRLRMSVGEPVVGNHDNTTCTVLSQGFFNGYAKKKVIIDSAMTAPGFSIYPNPVKDRLYIVCDNMLAKHVQFFDMLGHRLLTQTIASDHSVQTQQLPPGIYFGRLLNDKGAVLNIFKIIKL